MRTPGLTLLAAPLLASGCVVHSHRITAQQPVYASSVGTPYTWSHVRWCVWTEYYGCPDEEVYYLERSGYDDDDVLVMCHIARQARVPVRSVAYEYDRCGRSLYTTSLVFNLDPFAFYCREVPRDAACPGPYARAYGYYWRGERAYLTNDECRALVHLQIGVRYYGYGHASYFRDYDRCRSRNEHPFRTVVVRDYSRCGSGGKTIEEKVIVKKDRPWDYSSPKDWEKKREIEREKIKLACTPQKEKEEHDKARRAAEAPERKVHVEKVHVEANVLKTRRDEDDKKHAHEVNRDDGPRPPSRADKKPDTPPLKPGAGEARKTEPRPLESKPAEVRKPEPAPAPAKRVTEDRKPIEPKKVEERRPPPPPPPPPKKVEERRPPPPPPAPRRVEERKPAPAPERKPAEPRRSEQRPSGDSRKPEGKKK